MAIPSEILDFFATHKTLTGAFLFGVLCTLLLTPGVIWLAIATGVVDRPGHRKIHKQPTPLLGGLAIFAGMWLPLFLLALWDNDFTRRLQGQVGQFYPILLAGTVMLLVGVLDDKRGLNARWKFGFQVPLAIALILSGYSFKELDLPFCGPVQLGEAGFYSPFFGS